MNRLHTITLPDIHQNMVFCAPRFNGKNSEGSGGGSGNNRSRTCFDREALLRILDAYNKKYPKHKINFKRNASNQNLWSLIRDGMSNRCGDKEWCWLDQDFLKNDDVVQSYYKPPKPKEPYKWLSTSDIDNVLTQYEEMYPDFAFLGTVPIDFDKVIDEYKNLNLCKRDRKYKRYGFVFNMDPHDKKGSHWVCMFMDLNPKNPFIGFFDSYGYPPPKQILQLITRLKAQAKNCLGLNLTYKCNTIQHQRKNTECGVYCLYFIYQCLQGYSFETISENIILDDVVNSFRHFFFRPTLDYVGQQPT